MDAVGDFLSATATRLTARTGENGADVVSPAFDVTAPPDWGDGRRRVEWTSEREPMADDFFRFVLFG
jgi:hypothetical protein